MRCGVCEEGLVKYTCPRCSMKTCCLKCVKQHKADKDCNGMRDKTAFVSIGDFSDINLLNDYRFMEDASRKADSCQRDPDKRFRHLPKHLNMLLRESKKRGTTLKILPHVFTKRKKNQTRFMIKTQEIVWHVEWIFPQAEGTTYVRKVSENECLKESLASYIDTKVADPVIQHRLRRYIVKRDEEGVRLFLKRGQQKANTNIYEELDVNKTLGENLKDKYIVEYPTIHAVLGDHAGEYHVENTSADASTGNHGNLSSSQLSTPSDSLMPHPKIEPTATDLDSCSVPASTKQDCG